jgi:hypothetical protein
MNATKLFYSTLALAAAAVALSPAFAQSAEAKTRAQVRAEAIAARDAGQIEVGDTVGLRHVFDAPSQRTRAEVHAEAVAANRARTGAVTYGDSALLNRLMSGGSTLSRRQVQAEAIEARRLGLFSVGDRDVRTPTPAELESVRQAGLRAIGAENVAQRASGASN